MFFSSKKKKQKKNTEEKPINKKKNTSSHGALKKKEATKIVNDALSSKTFYDISAASQRRFEKMIEILQISTDDYLNGNSTADLNLLIDLNLLNAIDLLFRTSHAQGHMAGGAGVISHGTLADRERRLLAVVQRWARRSELSEKLSIQHGFLETLVFRIKYMLGSLQRYCSAQGHDEVIEDEQEDADTIRQRPKGRSRITHIQKQMQPTSPAIPATPTLPQITSSPSQEPPKLRVYEFHHKFYIEGGLGISIVDRAVEVEAKLTKKQKKRLTKNKNKKKNKKLPADDKIGIFVGKLINYGQADNLSRIYKGKDKEIRQGDKIIEVSGIDVCQKNSSEFIKIIKGGKKQVDLKFRGMREIKKKKRKSTPPQNKPSPLPSPSIPTPPSKPKSRRGRLIHKKGSLGGGRSEQGGRIRKSHQEHSLADAAVHSVDREMTSFKAKGVAALWVIQPIRQRRRIVKGVDLL